jgi:hypothetical protein
MASPPPFDLWDDLDDDIDELATAVPSDRHHAAAAPTPDGLNDRLDRSRLDTSPDPIPPAGTVLPLCFPSTNPLIPSVSAEAAAVGEARNVKIAGRRRLCKLGATDFQELQQQQQEEDHDDCEGIRGIMDDLTAGLDLLSVHKPNPTTSSARPPEQQLKASMKRPPQGGINIQEQ